MRGVDIVTRDASPAEISRVSDVELVAQARNGDLPSYGELVSRHEGAVYSIVSRMVANRDDVDDIVQDIFVQAYRCIGRFQGQAAFSTWVHSIAVNTTIKYLKKMKVRQALSIDDPETGIAEGLASEDRAAPPEAVLESERKTAVRRAVEQLPEKHRAVVVLRYFEDYSCEEIAKVMNCSMGTVWSRLHYACRKLRGQLEWLETA